MVKEWNIVGSFVIYKFLFDLYSFLKLCCNMWVIMVILFIELCFFLLVRRVFNWFKIFFNVVFGILVVGFVYKVWSVFRIFCVMMGCWSLYSWVKWGRMCLMNLIVKRGSNCFRVLSICKILIVLVGVFEGFLDRDFEMVFRDCLKRLNIILFVVFRVCLFWRLESIFIIYNCVFLWILGCWFV